MIGRIKGWFAGIPGDVRILIAGLAVIAPLKWLQTDNLRWMSVDGGYYTEVARHVRDGLGLTTHVSLNNFGYEHFPHPTSVYPLWPLLLGLIGKVAELNEAAHWVPAVLYFVGVIAAFLFGRRLHPESILGDSGIPLHGGHVAAVLLGFNRQFVVYTSLPYTEGLSWSLLFFFFWRLTRNSAHTTARWGVELGVWLSLLCFARSQFVVVPMAVGGALALRVLAGPDRARWLRTGGTAFVVLGVSLGLWLAHLQTFLVEAGPLSFLRFDQNRATTVLSDFDVIVEDQGVLDLLTDRLSGFGTAYSIDSARSWHASFGAANWALPAAALIALFSIRRPDAGWWRRPLAWIRAENGVLRISALLFAIGGMASIQLAHKHFNGEWYFYRRQGMIAMFAFLLPLLWMFRRRGFPAILAGGLLSTTVAMGGYEMVHQVVHAQKEAKGADKYASIVGWLKHNSSKKAPITVAFEEGTLQRIAWRTGNVGYHWLAAASPYSDVRAMVDKLGVDFVIFSGSRRWGLYKAGGGRIEAEFERLAEKPSGFTILKPRSTPLPPPVSRKVLLIGVDGASWKVMGPMIARGELPTFRKLWTEGASQTEFNTIESTSSPVVWTTVATGRRPKDHGVTEYTEEVEGVGKVPVTSNSRKVPAIWNVATKAGKSVGVVNWWASWPAETVNGYIVSDHANPAAAGWMDGKYWDADAAALAAMQEDTWPKELAESLRPAWLNPETFPKDDFLARSGLSEAQWGVVEQTPYNERTVYSWLKTFYTLDEPHVRIAIDKLRNDSKDINMVYLRGPDPIQHYGWNLVEPSAYGTSPEELARDRGIVEGVYRFTDTFVGELIAAAGPDTTIIVHSDHGAEPCLDAIPAKSTARPGCHTRAAKGVFFMVGPGISPGMRLRGASPMDVMPTMAWLAGLPISNELPGRVLSEAFDWDYAGRFGRTDVETYGEREKIEAPSTASPADAQMLEQLRGLGYIQ